MSRKQGQDSPWGKWALIALALLFVGSIIWSFVFETLMPLLAAGDAGAMARNLVGFPIILAGTAMFAYGGFVFVRDTFGVMNDPQLQENVALIREGETDKAAQRRTQWANARLLFGAWKAGALRMALGFGLIAVGGFVINL